MTNLERMLREMQEEQRDEFMVLLLQGLKWGPSSPISPRVFDAVCGAFTTTGVELAVVRISHEIPQVLLFRRPPSDRFYANQWHITGSLYYGHESTESVLARIKGRELDGLAITPPTYLRSNHFATPRGAEVTELYMTFAEAEYVGPGEWFSLESLPTYIIDHHRVLMSQLAAVLLPRC